MIINAHQSGFVSWRAELERLVRKWDEACPPASRARVQGIIRLIGHCAAARKGKLHDAAPLAKELLAAVEDVLGAWARCDEADAALREEQDRLACLHEELAGLRVLAQSERREARALEAHLKQRFGREQARRREAARARREQLRLLDEAVTELERLRAAALASLPEHRGEHDECIVVLEECLNCLLERLIGEE